MTLPAGARSLASYGVLTTASRDARAAQRVRRRAAQRRAAGQPHREPRRDGGGAAHPDRRPGGVQVRPRRHADQEQRPLAGVRDGVRGLLQPARPGVPHRRGRRRRARRAVPPDAGPAGRGPRRGRRQHGRAHAGGDRPPADAGAAQRRPGDDAGARPPGRAALRRDGARPTRRRDVLPVPHAAQPRPRGDARQADGRHPRAGRRRADLARGAPREGGVRAPHRQVQGRDRGRDPPPARRRPRRRGDGQDAAQAAARGRRVHARLAGGDAVTAQGAVPADPQARRPPRPQAPPRAQGSARLPQHRAPLAVATAACRPSRSSSTRGRPSPS